MRPPEFRQHLRDLPPAAPCTSPVQEAGLPDYFELPRYSQPVDFHGEILHNFPIHRTRQLHFDDRAEIQEVEERKSSEFIPVEVTHWQGEQRVATEMSDSNGMVPGLSGASPDVVGTGPAPEDRPLPRIANIAKRPLHHKDDYRDNTLFLTAIKITQDNAQTPR